VASVDFQQTTWLYIPELLLLGFSIVKVFMFFLYRKQILTALRNENVLIIAGDTGCGKSTQVPQYLLEAGYKRIGKHMFCWLIIFGVAAW
jgi:hypothetical protein